MCFNDTGLLFVFGLFGVQSLPYGACLGQNETISVSHRYGFCKFFQSLFVCCDFGKDAELVFLYHLVIVDIIFDYKIDKADHLFISDYLSVP